MKFEDIIKKFGAQPIIDTQMAASLGYDLLQAQVQLSRWVKAGKLVQLRRGCYLLAEPYRKVALNISYASYFMYKPSYVSLEYALGYYGLIPEGVPSTTSVTTRRPAEFITPIGTFIYHHIKKDLFWGYQPVEQNSQIAFFAFPEKALLDLFYFRKDSLTEPYFEEMRFQNFDTLDLKKLKRFARRFQSKRIAKGVKEFELYARRFKEEFKEL